MVKTAASATGLKVLRREGDDKTAVGEGAGAMGKCQKCQEQNTSG